MIQQTRPIHLQSFIDLNNSSSSLITTHFLKRNTPTFLIYALRYFKIPRLAEDVYNSSL